MLMPRIAKIFFGLRRNNVSLPGDLMGMQ